MGLEVFKYKAKYQGKEIIEKDLFNTFYAIAIRQQEEGFKVKKIHDVANKNVMRYNNLKELTSEWLLIDLIK